MNTISDINFGELQSLLAKFGLQVNSVDSNEKIPGSYWGEPEAGIIGNQLYVKSETPVHSALHEACHYICMDHLRRVQLDTDTGGDYDEENAVCYLQILLADYISNFNRQKMQANMDEWGYTFRLGSAKKWFELDAADARQWLLAHALIDQQSKPTWNVRA